MQITVIVTPQQIAQALAYVWGCETSAVVMPQVEGVSLTTNLKGANQAERFLDKAIAGSKS